MRWNAVKVVLDASRLTEASRQFAVRLLERLPALAVHAGMVARPDSDDFDLRVEVPSPVGDPKRQLVVWMEDTEPSIGFGEWHTHAGLLAIRKGSKDAAGALIAAVEAILSDQLVLTYDIGGEYDGDWGVIDLREKDALLDELTSKFSPGRVEIRTWSARGDREVGLEDLN
jgi:hypothetical protein